MILEPSGSGKSTLLNMMGGLDQLDSGSIEVDGVELTGLSRKQLVEYRREKIGVVFQSYNLIAELNVKENIRVVQDISKNPLDIEELLQDLGLKKHELHFPAELSGGQQQRCVIGRALIKNPAILLCDEPTGALDSSSARDVLGILEKVHEKYHTTIVIITHNEGIARMADRVIRIHDGKVIENSVNERVCVKELEYRDTKLRLHTQTQNVDLYTISEGRDIESGDELVLTYNYAKANSIAVGDKLKLAGREFTVCGLGMKSDYAIMLYDLSETIPNKSGFGIGIITQETMAELGTPMEFYSVRYRDPEQERAFRVELYQNYGTQEYVEKEANSRICLIYNEADDLVAEFTLYAPIIMVVVIAVIAMVLTRTVRREGKTIGTLMALGYRKKELIRHYMVYGMIPAFAGDVLGILFSIPFAKGDSFCFYNTVTMQETTVTISGIVKNDILPLVLTSKENVAQLLNRPLEEYNVIISKEKLTIPNGLLKKNASLQDYEEQVRNLSATAGIVLKLLKVLGMLICLLIVTMMSGFIIGESSRNISMLEVLGYRKGEVRRFVLTVNHFLVPVGFILGVPLGYLVAYSMILSAAQSSGRLMSLPVRPATLLGSFVFVLAAYGIAMALAGRKLKKVDMVETLKCPNE